MQRLAPGALRTAGLIAPTSGQFSIADPNGLEDAAGECDRMVHDKFDQLLKMECPSVTVRGCQVVGRR